MGYTTEFSGSISINPPLNQQEIEFLRKFNETRRMDRRNGPYHVEGSGFGRGDDTDVIDQNRPPAGQPGLWCQWVPTDDGTAIEWDGGEKFYDSLEWMRYLIDHFLKPGALAHGIVDGLQANHICNGTIKAQGEEMDDRWKLIVTDNQVSRIDLE